MKPVSTEKIKNKKNTKKNKIKRRTRAQFKAHYFLSIFSFLK